MLKKGEPKEKVEISSKEFTKKFIKNFILNGLMIGIVLAIIYELVAHFINNNIIKEILYFGLIFFAINKIHVAAVKDSFFDSYISGDNIRKSKNNISLIFIVIFLFDIVCSIISLTRLSSLFETLGTIYLKQFIVKTIINIVLYAIIIVFCRDTIDQECDKIDTNNKNYLTKKVILIIVFAIIVIIGTIINNQQNSYIPQNDKNDKVTSTNKQNNNLQETNEINLQLVNESNTEYPSYTAKSNDGKVELNISSFATKIKEDEKYMIEKVSDGILVFYTIAENNFVEKLDLQGNSKWKIKTDEKVDNCIEVSDGYFIIGSKPYYYNFVLKVSKTGNIISSKQLEKTLSNPTFIESEKDIQNGEIEIIAINPEGKNGIISFDNTGNQKNISYINLNVVCKKVIKENGFYYGIGADSTVLAHERKDETIFKLDNNGKEIFKYSILQNTAFSKEEIDTTSIYTEIYDIAVNNKYIFIVIKNTNDDVFVLDLNGNLKNKVGYSTNTELNKGTTDVSIYHIKANNNGVYVFTNISSYDSKPYYSQSFIDKISNNLNLEYRFNIPELEKSKLETRIALGKFTDNTWVDAHMYDDYAMVIHQYKFN